MTASSPTAYCTYFDRGYLAQGLALWESLRRRQSDAVLWVLALDEDAADVLRKLGDERLRVIPLAELLAADPELAALQTARARAEFIFTLTPCLVRHLLRTEPAANPVFYLDADLYFFDDPVALRTDLGAGSVYVVPHRYPSWHDDSRWYGRFNVGVLGFRADANGFACVDWWRRQCLQSCALIGDGIHYGDQKYLDAWPEKFDGVVVSAHPGINLAPWNWAGHRFTVGPGVKVDGQPLVVFHFAQFRRMSSRWSDSGQLEYGVMPLRLRSRLYGEYADALATVEAAMQRVRPDLPLRRQRWRATFESWTMLLLRAFWGQCWCRVGPWWIAGRFGLGRFSGHAMGWYRRRQRRER